MKKTITIITIIIIIIVISRNWWGSQLSPVSSDTSTKVFVVAKGSGVSEIARKLKQENLIYVKQGNFTNKLQAGSYKLSQSLSLKELVGNLQTGSEDIWVTLIEGWRVEEMAAELSTKYQVPSTKFMELAKEGYMFPDTYLFPKEATVEYITDILRKTFDKRYSAELRSKIRTQGLTEDQGVILASIVEREARSDKVRTSVASILLKRFKIDMGLNADATIQYALGKQADGGWWKKNLTRDDLKIESPYNTYFYRGLPPKPICNPSLSSLEAVANADVNTPYLYYYHDSKGNSYYGKTLEEHNQNIANHP